MRQLRETPKKLGQLLVERGWATGEQVLRAVRSQRDLGGLLGTCLLELDVVEEDRLIEILSEQQGAPAVGVDHLRAIPEEVLELVPPKVAARFLVIPFSATDRDVDVAALNARDMALIDELAFCTNRRVRVHVVSEVRIYEALAKYYGIECPRRYAQLVDRLNRSRYLWKDSPPAAEAPALGVDFGSAGDGIVWDRPEDVLRGTEPALAAARATLAIDDVERRLKRAQSPEKIGDVVAGCLRQLFRRAALLQVRRGHVAGWRGHGEGLEARLFGALEIGLREPSVFLDLARGVELHLGALPPMPTHRRLIRCWGLVWPAECLVIPVRMHRRVAAFLYGDRVSEPLSDLPLEDLKSLSILTANSLELCILRRKLQAN